MLMSIGDVIGLTREQFEIVNIIVGWIAVFVMDDLSRLKKATKMVLHNDAVFKDIGSCAAAVRERIRVMGHIAQHISIFPCLATTSPGRGIFTLSTIHWVVFASEKMTFAIHRIVLAANVPMVRRVGVSLVSVRNGATYGAENPLVFFICCHFLSALKTLNGFLELFIERSLAISITKPSALCDTRLVVGDRLTMFTNYLGRFPGLRHDRPPAKVSLRLLVL